MLNAMELAFGRFGSTQSSPIGTYVNMRTLAYYQQASDGVLPSAGIWHLVSTNASLPIATLASTINTALGSAYTAASFHAYSSGTDALSASQLGQVCNDA
ncbi:hypothetical protein [Ktedonospora formicarum]|uniref:Uncharacterized protein n=1 Tax=Ktedonospora formicarum TaxID=2778364 RepID=A0A8J3I905_9CHLR|nr:hypothetical protein [Ktedonospora formicarum]GHO47988.1 hypothetical protein KSX_61510 [Ktedonospora formicarum]